MTPTPPKPPTPESSRNVLFAVCGVILVGGTALVLRPVLAPSATRGQPAPSASAEASGTTITDIGPRLVSNQTATPILVAGRDLEPGKVLELGPPANAKVTLAAADATHRWAWAKLPPIDLPSDQSEADIAVTFGGGKARITVVNDLHFPDPVGLAAANDQLCAISPPTDEMRCVPASGGSAAPRIVLLGDGPSAIATYGESFVVGHEFLPELWVLPAAGGPPRKIPGPRNVAGVATALDTAYVSEHQHDQLWAVDLAQGTVLWRCDVDPGPGRVTVAGDLVAVGSRQTGDVQLVDRSTGKLVATLAPGPGLPIFGGHTEAFSSSVDGGLGVRDLAYSPRRGLLFVASAGPNIGPNTDRMAVAMNGGVTVIDVRAREVRYHLGFGSGVTEGLALDDEAGVLYASDIATGLVRALDMDALAQAAGMVGGPDRAGAGAALSKAILATVPIPPPDGFASIRPAEDLGTKDRAGPELHTGPDALVFLGSRLFALDRMTGTLATLSTSGHGLGKPTQTKLFDMLTQTKRRLGEILYYTDVGRTGMSCESCHIDGHVGGVLFTKTPLRMYRSTSMRGARETPPYFIPPMYKSLSDTASFLGGLNRYQNPPLSEPEVDALAVYASEIPTPPNPFVGADGAPTEDLTLPDGKTGHPRAGAELFFGKGGCKTCHTGPLFATDASPATRGRLMDVGTPDRFALRTELQEAPPTTFPPPSLLGIWDLFPLTTTGSIGLTARDGKLVVDTRFPLRALLDYQGSKLHGNVGGLTVGEKNDLLAFLLTL